MKCAIYSYLGEHHPALDLFKQLEIVGNIYLIGGVLREFRDYGEIHSLRDIDVVVDVKKPEAWKRVLQNYAFKVNRFGGNKLICQGLVVDAWAIEETWAFRNHIIPCDAKDYVKYLPETVFLNIDSIIFDWTNEQWSDKKYQEAMETKILDIVLPDNPQLLLNIVRAFILRERYHMIFSRRLQKVILEEYEKAKDMSEFCQIIYQEQIRRYERPVLSEEKVISEMSAILL